MKVMTLLRKIFDLFPLTIVQKILAPAYWFCSQMLFKKDAFEGHLGIVIAEFGPEEGLDPLFVPKTKEALDYLAELDPRRFRRVQSEIRAIVKSGSNRYLGSYVRPPRVCMINFSSLSYDKGSKFSRKLYVCTLVHEATHGLIDSKGIPTNGKNRSRKECLCVEEEIRVARKFNDGHEKLWEQLHREKLVTGFLNPELLNKIQ
jgi:hypothetical protein